MIYNLNTYTSVCVFKSKKYANEIFVGKYLCLSKLKAVYNKFLLQKVYVWASSELYC